MSDKELNTRSAKTLRSLDWLLVGLLFLLTLASRVPFVSRVLYHWDSVNFAFAMQEFNLAKEQPQPPGYIAYVWLTRLVDLGFNNAQNTMVTISVIASALAVAALFYLAKSMFGRTTSFIAALFLAASPLFWFYGEIALPHTLDTALVIICGGWLYKTMRGERRYLYPAVIAAAVVGGIRPQTLVFLAPLILFSVRAVGWRRLLIAAALGAAICLVWFIPLMSWSGGVANYLAITQAYGDRFEKTTSVFAGAGWFGLRRNLIKLTLYTLYAWSVALLPAAVYAGYRLYRRQMPRRWENILFLLIWALPPLLFYLLIHMGQQGLVFIFLPVLLVLSAESLKRLFPAKPVLLFAGVAVIVLFNMAVFCWLPEYPVGSPVLRLLTRATLANSDAYYQTRFAAIKQNFPPDTTVIVAENWHHLNYYLPEYTVLPFDVGAKWEVNENAAANTHAFSVSPGELGLNANSQPRLVIFDPELVNFLAKPAQLNRQGVLDYLDWPVNATLEMGSQKFGFAVK